MRNLKILTQSLIKSLISSLIKSYLWKYLLPVMMLTQFCDISNIYSSETKLHLISYKNKTRYVFPIYIFFITKTTPIECHDVEKKSISWGIC